MLHGAYGRRLYIGSGRFHGKVPVNDIIAEVKYWVATWTVYGQTGAVAPGQLRSGSSFRHTWSTSSRNVFAAAAPMPWTLPAIRTWNYHLENLSKDRKITRWELKYHSAGANKDLVEECGL